MERDGLIVQEIFAILIFAAIVCWQNLVLKRRLTNALEGVRESKGFFINVINSFFFFYQTVRSTPIKSKLKRCQIKSKLKRSPIKSKLKRCPIRSKRKSCQIKSKLKRCPIKSKLKRFPIFCSKASHWSNSHSQTFFLPRLASINQESLKRKMWIYGKGKSRRAKKKGCAKYRLHRAPAWAPSLKCTQF